LNFVDFNIQQSLWKLDFGKKNVFLRRKTSFFEERRFSSNKNVFWVFTRTHPSHYRKFGIKGWKDESSVQMTAENSGTRCRSISLNGSLQQLV